ncbi:MAG TPA: aldehyde dehydrogenase family protein, partial [Pirellulales bacterium]|nr:aldehyde dehydrogenase family protein [Pirellulales bacterium]
MSGRLTNHEEIDRCLNELAAAKGRFARLPLPERIRLAESCAEGTFRLAGEWLAAACEAKGIALDSPLAGEELATGPLATTRYLQLLVRSLQEIEVFGRPQLPGEVVEDAGGRLRIQVFPARGMYDEWLFRGFRADVWLQPGVSRENLDDALAPAFAARLQTEKIALVLGAGNVSSIPAVDAFGKLFAEGRVVLLKLNPVNEYLGPIFERAYGSVIEAGVLRLIYGGAETGGYAVSHPLVDEVHITGSIASHDAIVWGQPGEERDARRKSGQPLLTKPITSELGNVTPWIVVPGPYRERELDFQAENVAAMIVNNASFNCIACKLIVTWRRWPARQKFLDKIDASLARTPRRKAYYPGAVDRFRRFSGREPEQNPPGTLPWTLVRDIDPDREPRWIEEESFVCACAETALDADGPEEFLDRAVDFVNERVWGTLGAGLMVHPRSRKGAANEAHFQQA